MQSFFYDLVGHELSVNKSAVYSLPPYFLFLTHNQIESVFQVTADNNCVYRYVVCVHANYAATDLQYPTTAPSIDRVPYGTYTRSCAFSGWFLPLLTSRTLR